MSINFLYNEKLTSTEILTDNMDSEETKHYQWH